MSPTRAQLVWLCRRGTRELDLLLRNYLDHVYDQASPIEQESFTQLLQKHDDELKSLVFGPDCGADRRVSQVIERILDSTQAMR